MSLVSYGTSSGVGWQYADEAAKEKFRTEGIEPNTKKKIKKVYMYIKSLQNNNTKVELENKLFK